MELGVERLVLPAVPSVLNAWTTSFGFSQMADFERLQFLDYTFLEFQDTIMCQKLLMKIPSADSRPLKGFFNDFLLLCMKRGKKICIHQIIHVKKYIHQILYMPKNIYSSNFIHAIFQELSLKFMMRSVEVVILLMLTTPVLSLKYFRRNKLKIEELWIRDKPSTSHLSSYYVIIESKSN